MRNVFLTVGMLFLASIVSAQTVVGPNSQYSILLEAVNVTDAGINRFELSVNNGTWVSIGLPTSTTDVAEPGFLIYKHPIGSLGIGIHNTKARACNVIECGPESGPFTFQLLAVPGTPTIRLTPTISGNGIVMNRYPFLGLDVIDVYFPVINTTLNFAAPTFTFPGVYNVQRNDNVELSFWK